MTAPQRPKKRTITVSMDEVMEAAALPWGKTRSAAIQAGLSALIAVGWKPGLRLTIAPEIIVHPKTKVRK